MNVGLLFGMVFAIFLIVMIVVFGYQQIQAMQSMQEEAEIKRALQDLETAVDRVHGLSGETSQPFKLSFPGGVTKVCFIPAYRGESIATKKNRLAADLRSVIDGSSQDKLQLSALLVSQRITKNPEGFGEMDKNMTLLIFFQKTAVPLFKNIPHLEPSRKSGLSGGQIACTGGLSSIWLERKFDETGAWVDVDIS
jgi:hypothetical protein